MCDEGIMEKFQIDEVYGIHNDPGSPLGVFKTCIGPNMAAADDFTIRIYGQGGHAAEPDETIDPLITGAQLVQAIQTISSRNLSALEKVVISITQFHAGTTHNIIPNDAFINGARSSGMSGSGPAIIIIVPSILQSSAKRIKSTLGRLMPEKMIIETKFLAMDSDELEL